jgi:hypothetical protein
MQCLDGAHKIHAIVAQRGLPQIDPDDVGQVGNLRRIGNPPGLCKKLERPIANRPLVTNLPTKQLRDRLNKIVAARKERKI